MNLIQAGVIDVLRGAGIYRPTWFLADSSLQTVDKDWVANEAWPNWVASLPPQLVNPWPVGGGKTVMCPKWEAEVFDCDNHALDFNTYVVRCFAVDAIQRKVNNGAPAFGTMAYVAVPKAGNRRQGGHDINWFIGHDLKVYWFEPAEGIFVDPLPIEIASVFEGEQR